MTENQYDKKDMVQRVRLLRASGPQHSLKMAVYRVRDPETGEYGPRQFHATIDNTVLAVMGEESAKLFVRFVTDELSATHTPDNR